MIPKRFGPLLFGAVLSVMMTCVVSFVSTFNAIGFVQSFASVWLKAWALSFTISFPIVLVVRPLTQRIVDRLLGD